VASGFSKRLKQLREQAGLSQQDLADRADMHRFGIAKIEQGLREPSWATVQALAKALGTNCLAFVDEDDAEEPANLSPPGKPGRPRKASATGATGPAAAPAAGKATGETGKARAAGGAAEAPSGQADASTGKAGAGKDKGRAKGGKGK